MRTGLFLCLRVGMAGCPSSFRRWPALPDGGDALSGLPGSNYKAQYGVYFSAMVFEIFKTFQPIVLNRVFMNK